MCENQTLSMNEIANNLDKNKQLHPGIELASQYARAADTNHLTQALLKTADDQLQDLIKKHENGKLKATTTEALTAPQPTVLTVTADLHEHATNSAHSATRRALAAAAWTSTALALSDNKEYVSIMLKNLQEIHHEVQEAH